MVNGGNHMTEADAKSIVLKNHSDSIVVGSFELKDGFVFSLQPKDLKDDYILDGFFKIDKSTGKESEYSPLLNIEEFREAIKR